MVASDNKAGIVEAEGRLIINCNDDFFCVGTFICFVAFFRNLAAN